MVTGFCYKQGSLACRKVFYGVHKREWRQTHSFSIGPCLLYYWILIFTSIHHCSICIHIIVHCIVYNCDIILNLVCPCRTRTDPGTENPILAKCQMFLRRHHNDELQGPNSHYTGSSEINQVNSMLIFKQVICMF